MHRAVWTRAWRRVSVRTCGGLDSCNSGVVAVPALALPGVCLPFSVSMCVSTVYGRYHYIADVLAGIAVGAIGLAAGSWLMERKGALAEIAE